MATRKVNGVSVELTPQEESDFEASRAVTTDQLIERLKQHRDSLFYQDIIVTFPVGDRVVRFSNDRDRMNLESVVNFANTLPGATNVQFTTGDGVRQTLTATQMISVGQSVMIEKQGLFDTYYTKKAEIQALDQAGRDTYDITGGW